MQGVHLRKYGVQTTIDFEVYEVDGVDFRVDWVPAAADCEVMKDGGTSTQCTNTAVDEGSTYSIVLTATEMEAARLVFKAVDAATKVFLDKSVIIETYGHPSAMHAMDFDDSVRGGLTALPNAAADAAGGLPISDAGGLDMDTTDSNVSAILTDTGTTIPALLPAALVGGKMDSNVGAVSGDTAAADNLELDYDGTGYAKANSTIGTTTTNTDMRGTDSAATASALSTHDGKLDTVDGNVDSILVDTGTTIPALLPAALVGGKMDSNVGAISGATAPADTLEEVMLGVGTFTAVTGTLSTTQMTTNLTEATPDHVNGRQVVFVGGVLDLQATDITDYDGATKLITMTAITEAPVNGQKFNIV